MPTKIIRHAGERAPESNKRIIEIGGIQPIGNHVVALHLCHGARHSQQVRLYLFG